ncbi:transposase [bacterium]|nr:transposase [bacterium]
MINRFVDRHPFFTDNEDYRQFLDVYFENAATFGIWTYAYDLLPNHFHFVMETPSGEISRFLQRFLTSAVQKLNQRHKRVGHLLQGRTKTLLVQTDRYFHTVMGYALLNGVRAGLAKDVFSDTHNSVKEMLNPLRSRLARGPLWEYLFGRKFDLRRVHSEIRMCRRWLSELNVEGNAKEFRQGHRGSFLSTAVYREKVLRMIERRRDETGHKHRRETDRHRKSWTWPEIKIAADRAVEKSAWKGIWKNRETAVRHIRWYISIVGAGWTYEETCELEGAHGRSHSRRAVAIHAIRNTPRKKNIADRAISLCLN